VSVVYGTTANVAGAAIQNFRISPLLLNRIGTSNSNLEASQVPNLMVSHWWLFTKLDRMIAVDKGMNPLQFGSDLTDTRTNLEMCIRITDHVWLIEWVRCAHW